MKKCILLLAIVTFQYCLHCQNSSGNLVQNVVKLEGAKKGFGFIIGENKTTRDLYIVTAGHVIFGDKFDAKPSKIGLNFYDNVQKYFLEPTEIFSEDLDLALVTIKKPSDLTWRVDCGDFQPKRQSTVNYIGKNEQWVTSRGGIIESLDDRFIYFGPDQIMPGTSGAPLISECGIVGLILENNGTNRALKVESIKQFLTSNHPSTFSIDHCATNIPHTCPKTTTPLIFTMGQPSRKEAFSLITSGFQWYSGDKQQGNDSWEVGVDIPKCATKLTFNWGTGKITSSDLGKDHNATVLIFSLNTEDGTSMGNQVQFRWRDYQNKTYPGGSTGEILIPESARGKRVKLVLTFRDAWNAYRIAVTVTNLSISFS